MPTPDTRPDRSPGAYWKATLRLVGILLAIWAAVSYGAGIVFADVLNRFTLPGTTFPMGFWFAQQGSIYVFVILIFVYVVRMNALDREFGVDEGGDSEPGSDR